MLNMEWCYQPTSISRSSPQDADNIDSKARGNFSLTEFHGYALSVTNHLSHGNLRVKRAPIKLDTSDTPTPKLPDAYAIQPPIKLTQQYVFEPMLGNSEVRPADAKDEAWMAHVTRVMK